MTNIVIDIAAEFTGKKAFKQADTATQTLAKGAKKLGAALGLAYSTKAIVNYVKQASIAAAQDQKAQAILAVNLKNLGLAYANLDSEQFISNLERQTLILDDQLRPAYAKLASATGSISKTQQLMQVAFDASAKAGLDYSTTVEILAQAYLGNTKGLKQLQTGLTKAEIAGMTFDQILEVIQKRSAGAGKESLKGYAAQMEAFDLATDNAAETLGGAFLDSFKKLLGGGDIVKATGEIDGWSKALANLIRVTTGVIKINDIFRGVEFGGFLGIVPKQPVSGPRMQSPGERAAAVAAAAAAKKRAEAAAKAAAAAAAKLAKLTADNLKLAKARAIFDLQKINIEAALKGKISEEDRIRLKLMQAIENENITQIEKYTKLLTEAQAKTAALTEALAKAGTNKIGDVFAPEFYRGMTAADVALEKLKESGKLFKIGNPIGADFYAGLTAAQKALELFKESGGFRAAGVIPGVIPEAGGVGVGVGGNSTAAAIAAATAAAAEAAAKIAANAAAAANAMIDEAGGAATKAILAAEQKAAALLAAAQAAAAAAAAASDAAIAEANAILAGLKASAGGINDRVEGPSLSGSGAPIIVNVEGSIIAQADLERAIQDAINAARAAGNVDALAPKSWRGE